MPISSYLITCTDNRVIARDVYEIRFTKPEGFTFIPGQFVLFDVPLLENLSDVQTRAYSIASAPQEGDLLFVIKMKAGGRASRWFVESLKVGDTVRMQGPFGVFTLDRSVPNDWLFVCTSAGLAPFRSQLVAFLPQEARRIDLIFGVHAEEDFFWLDEIRALLKSHPNFRLHLTLSVSSSSWTGHVGHVQTLLPDLLKNRPGTKVYICGNPEMTKEVKRMCIEEFALPKADVHMEGYI